MSPEVFLHAAVVLLCAGWCVLYLRTAWNARSVEIFEDATTAVTELPRISVIVPACNEVDHLEEALRSLRAQDHPDLQVVLVDDRSTDGTTELVDRLAGEDARIRPLHVEELPDGWLGKVHAMHRALDVADGEFLLFTDADVEFSPGALADAEALMVERGLDHLAIIPDIESRGFALEAMVSAFGVMLIGGSEVSRLRDPEAVVPFGVGAFNLVRRSAFERTPGFEWLRMEVADDFGLGLMLARAGARQDAMVSHGDIRVEWYASLGEMVRGLEKNLFGVTAKYSLTRAVVAVTLGSLLVFAPVIALFVPGGWIGGAAAAVAVTAMATSTYFLARRTGRRWSSLIPVPITQLVIFYAVLRSSIRGTVNRGITWRGTHYPLEELRKMQRVNL